jgi:hypothetical protein
MEHRSNTVQFGCKLIGNRVLVTLDHSVETLGGEGGAERVRVSAQVISCSGAANCGWKHTHLSACPYRCASGI